MKGNVLHDTWIATTESNKPAGPKDTAKRYDFEIFQGPTLCLANTDDSYYWQGFENWTELREFITMLENEGRKAWGEELR